MLIIITNIKIIASHLKNSNKKQNIYRDETDFFTQN